MSFKIWILFPIYFPSLKKLDHFSYSFPQFGFCYWLCPRLLTLLLCLCTFWKLMSDLDQIFGSSVCKVLLYVLSGSLSIKTKWASEWEWSHISNNERQHSQLFMYMFYVIFPFSLYLNSMIILKELLDWTISSIKIIISKPKTTYYVLWILQVPVPSAFRTGGRNLKNSHHCSINYSKNKSFHVSWLFSWIRRRQNK